MSTQRLIRAIVLFPLTHFDNAAEVRHARRRWIAATEYLAKRRAESGWPPMPELPRRT